MVKIALAQVSATADYEANLKKGFRMMEQAKRKGALIICFPEMAFRIFFPQYRGERKYFEWAETVPGPTTERFQQKAKELEIVTIINLYEKTPKGEYYDCSPVIDADGALLGISRMMHIAEGPRFNEKFYYWQGNTDYPVFHTNCVNIGMLICHDRHFPECFRILALKGAEIVFIPNANTVKFFTENRNFFEMVNQAASMANHLYTAVVNRVGAEEHLNFCGSSFVTSPDGNVIAQANPDGDELLVVNIDLDLVQYMRVRWPFFRDRRSETYGEIIQTRKCAGRFTKSE